MHEAYSLAHREILDSLRDGGNCLDCGEHNGDKYNLLKEEIDLEKDRYYGIEWSKLLVLDPQKKT